MGEAHHHRSTLKQKNKPFKSKHGSKSELRDQSKGRVARQSPKSSPHSNTAVAQLKANRRNSAKQAQVKKRQERISSTRIFNGVDGTPRIVAIVPLSEDVSARSVACALAGALDVVTEDCPEVGFWKLKAERFKTSLQFLLLPHRQFYATLDACKAADYVLFALSDSTEVDAWGDTLLRTLQAQGFPTVVTCIAPSLSPGLAKERAGIAKSLLSFISYFVPSQSRVFDLGTGSSSVSSDSFNALRALCEGRPGDVRWREGRACILAEEVKFSHSGDAQHKGTLEVTGFVRGGVPLDVNRLVHLVGVGDFQVEKINSAPLPRPSNRKATLANSGMELDQPNEAVELTLAEADVDEADSLVSTNEPDDMAGDQTWPSEDEMGLSSSAIRDVEDTIPDAPFGTTPKEIVKSKTRKTIRRPKGMSEYQASWLVWATQFENENEDEEDEEDEAGIGEDDHMDKDDGGELDHNTGDEEEYEEEEEEDGDDHDVDMGTNASNRKSKGKSVAFEDLGEEEEAAQLNAWRSRHHSKEEEDQEREDAEFPDEVDTPRETPARVRFARYRGLRSLRTSPWDAYENLPRDYGRVFALDDWKKVERSVRRRAEETTTGVEPGTRVTVYLKGVPEAEGRSLEDALRMGSRPVMLFALFAHEHKMTVLNFTVQRNTEYSEPVKSKDPMVLCYGPRRIRVGPIYSQLTRGGGGKGANNVHKFERWLRHAQGGASVATTYAPVCFGGGGSAGGGVPCTLLREVVEDLQAPQLVATGAFLNADTTRIVAKRILLTGHPFKVHKKTATVRYMFFNPEDISYFKPIQLYTKHGRTGHIRSSLGTHGYYKAHFDGPVSQMDTVCMSLYKRVYPRWPSNWRENRVGDSTLMKEEKMGTDCVAMEE